MNILFGDNDGCRNSISIQITLVVNDDNNVISCSRDELPLFSTERPALYGKPQSVNQVAVEACFEGSQRAFQEVSDRYKSSAVHPHPLRNLHARQERSTALS